MPGKKRLYQSAAEKQKAYRQKKAREKNNARALLYAPKESVKTDRPPVRYYGGKWRIAPWIIQHFPAHIAYVEPYAGGAGVLFRKEPSKFEVLNDLNGDIVAFFDVLRSTPEALIRAIQLTPHSREELRRAYCPAPAGDLLEKARRFYVRSRQSFGSGEGVYSTGWRYQADDRRGTSVVDEWNHTDHLWDAARRLKMVQIESDEALRVIKRFDKPTTLFYIDPPYLFETRYSTEARYRHELTNEQHSQLADVLREVQGMVIVSGYDSELYRELYKGWSVVCKATRTNANHEATEYLWLSPRNGSQLFDNQLAK